MFVLFFSHLSLSLFVCHYWNWDENKTRKPCIQCGFQKTYERCERKTKKATVYPIGPSTVPKWVDPVKFPVPVGWPGPLMCHRPIKLHSTGLDQRKWAIVEWAWSINGLHRRAAEGNQCQQQGNRKEEKNVSGKTELIGYKPNSCSFFFTHILVNNV